MAAIGLKGESLSDWRERHEIDTKNQVRLVRLSHMRYQFPDFKDITTFLRGELPLRSKVISQAKVDWILIYLLGDRFWDASGETYG